MKSIILASQSPRRREILERFCKNLIIRVDSSAEEKIDGEAPEEMVMRLALEKARNVAAKTEEAALVIGADTVVVLDGKVLGKPKSRQDASMMLSSLSGRENTVCTGIAVLDTESGKEATAMEMTTVCFRALSKEDIEAYIASGEADDKAGAYGIQGLGALFIEKIHGDYFNVVGLPICRLGKLLKESFSLDLLAEV